MPPATLAVSSALSPKVTMMQANEAPAARWMVGYTAIAFAVQIVAVLVYQQLF